MSVNFFIGLPLSTSSSHTLETISRKASTWKD
nr:MAG TPA: hypothetical protein [Caudoviricetes sp.]DAU01245.1 MAG TPA: hypothetical protein [Caudoviricetes sp.]